MRSIRGSPRWAVRRSAYWRRERAGDEPGQYPIKQCAEHDGSGEHHREIVAHEDERRRLSALRHTALDGYRLILLSAYVLAPSFPLGGRFGFAKLCKRPLPSGGHRPDDRQNHCEISTGP